MSQVFSACITQKSSTKIFYDKGDIEENTQQGGHVLNSMLSAGQK
jgi:hypothetical protein